MGWDFIKGASKKDVIKEVVTKGDGWRTVKYTVVNEVVYAIVERLDDCVSVIDKYIEVTLLENDPNYGWGYKIMDESMGPYAHACPLEYLDEVPLPENEHMKSFAEDWRDRVRAHHARR